MPEFFAQPDDTGDLQASDLNTSLGERLFAQAGEAMGSGLRTMVRNKEYSDAESAQEGLGSQIQRLQNGEDLGDVIANPQPSKLIPQTDAQERVKQAGVTGIKLPAGDIREPVLDLMIKHAHEREQYDAALARGPTGLIPGALGFATEVGAGMIDPINVAAFSIPVMGEARFGMMLARAGDSAAQRAMVRAGVGAAQGAVGSTLLEPAQWWLHTRDGQDYTYADALRGVIMGAAMGGAFGAAHGVVSDVRARGAGRPLAGSTEDLAARALAGDEQAASILQATPEGRRALAAEQPTQPAEATPATAAAAPATEEAPPGLAPAGVPEPELTAAQIDAIKAQRDEVRERQAAALDRQLDARARGDETGEREAETEYERLKAEAMAIGSKIPRTAGRGSIVLTPEARAAGYGVIPEPEAVFTDLPAQVREDTVRASMADAINGNLGRGGELLKEAAKEDPRIAESIAAGRESTIVNAAEFSEPARAVFTDMHAQLKAAGMSDDEAAANAAVVAARYEARAARLEGAGGTAEDLYRAEGIRVQRGGTEDELGRSFAQRRRPLPGQTDLFGGERATDAEMAQRGANEPLRPGVAQKPMDEGLFGDTAAQSDLVDAAKGRQLFQPPTVPTFFSAVSRAIGSARQEKASPEQWLATLRNTPGVKPEEIKWLGIEDWLKEQKGSVTRQQVQDYVRANNIEVREVAKGGFLRPEDEVRSDQIEDLMAPMRRIANASLTPEYEALRREADALNPKPTKFHTYTLPGGENYRELLLTLPARSRETADLAARHEAAMDAVDEYLAQRPDARHGGDAQYTALANERDRLAQQREDVEPSYYRSSHFDEPNILSHIRFNDRTVDGKKTLFIEEIQSDWHQAGKRQGYAKPFDVAKPEDLIGGKQVGVTGEFEQVPFPHDGPDKWEFTDQRTGATEYGWGKSEAEARANALDYVNGALRRAAGGGGVPDAPFKTTWPELAFKRMIRYAAENGYEKIAWTPGEVQAERYDLSKHVREIEYVKNGDGTYTLGVTDKNGQGIDIPNGGAMTLADIENTVGKEIAEKVSKEEGKRYRGHQGITLDGLDLKVGGEGMKGFYDKILPATVNKLVKKYGAKVEDATIGETAELHGWDIHSPGGGYQRTVYSPIEAQDARREGMTVIDNGAPDTANATVHAIDLSEPLRKAATEEGFPLFQREPGGEMRGRITLADNKAIIDLFRSADKSTFMHETGHLWLDEMARDAARENAPEGIRKDMETVLKWLGAERPDAITEEQHEKWARGFETYLASGEAPTSALRTVFAKFKEWLSAIYKGIVGAGETITPEIRAVMDRMVATPEQLGEGEHAPNVVEGPRAARGPRSRDPETFSLLEFLASRGGIRASDPLIGDVRGSFGGKNKFVPGFGQLIRQPRELSTAQRVGGGRAPMTLDQARDAAVEADYLRDAGEHTGGTSETTVRTLLDAIDREARGQRVYREGYEPKGKLEFDPDEEMHRLHSAIDDAVRDSGIDPVALPDATRARILEIMTKEGERDPEIAYERAIMEETHYGTEQGRAEQIQDHVPGWDIPDVGRPAQAPGGPAEGLRRSQDAGAGAAPRGTGGDERQASGAGNGAAAARNGNGAAAARPAPDWRALAAAARSDDADLIAPSRAAAKEKPPESTDTPERAVSAAELKAKEAEQLLADLLPRLTEDERTLMTDMLNAADRDRAEREQIVREGAACLAAGLVAAV